MAPLANAFFLGLASAIYSFLDEIQYWEKLKKMDGTLHQIKPPKKKHKLGKIEPIYNSYLREPSSSLLQSAATSFSSMLLQEIT